MKKGRNTAFIILLFALVVVLAIMSILQGDVGIDAGTALSAVFGNSTGNEAWDIIITDIRLPKMYTSILAGGGLAVSGLLMQSLFRNPLAGPYVLGISSGASLGVALLVLTGASIGSFANVLGGWSSSVAAMLGAGLVMVLALLASFRLRSNMAILIVGVMFGSITSALISTLQYYSNPEELQSYINWTFGSVQGVEWNELGILAIAVLTGVVFAVLLFKSLNAFLLGEEYAQSMGVDVKRVRYFVIFITAILAGSITAFCGPIAFVGLAIPHIVRGIVKHNQHEWLLPMVFLAGASMLLICDMAAGIMGEGSQLPLNAISSLLGAPIVIWVILRNKNYQM